MSLWVDKYRPNTFNKLDYHKEQAEKLKKLVNDFERYYSFSVGFRKFLMLLPFIFQYHAFIRWPLTTSKNILIVSLGEP